MVRVKVKGGRDEKSQGTRGEKLEGVKRSYREGVKRSCRGGVITFSSTKRIRPPQNPKRKRSCR